MSVYTFSMKRLLFAVGIILAGSIAMASGETHGLKTAGDETVRPVFSSPLANAPGQALTAVVVTYAPGGKSQMHRHAGSVFAYVLSGSVRSENSATGPVRIYKAGESFFEPSGSEHLISENASATEPASFLAVFVAPEHAELTHIEKH